MRLKFRCRQSSNPLGDVNRNYEVFWGEAKETRSFEDRHASHYVKVMLDQIFGENNFQNEIIWKRQSSHNDAKQGSKHFGRVHDTLFFYSGGKSYTFNHQYRPYDPEYTRKFYRHVEEGTGRRYSLGDIVLDAYCGCGTAITSAQLLDRQWIGIDVSPTACRVMAKRLRDVCGIDGRIYPVSALEHQPRKQTQGLLPFLDHWYPVQVKQKDKVGRPDIDSFEAVMHREEREIGYFVGFDFTDGALREIRSFERKTGKRIIPMRVHDILRSQGA